MLNQTTPSLGTRLRAVSHQQTAPQKASLSPFALHQSPSRSSTLTVRAAAVAERSHTMTTSKAMDAVFPESLSVLEDVDPEVASIIEDEKARQW